MDIRLNDNPFRSVQISGEIVDVSITIPTLNEAKYIRRTLDSLKAQKTKRSFEIILGDGRSTDGTPKIAKEYGCKVVSVKPGIIAVGRQAAAEKATGKVIVVANADMYYPPDWLEGLAGPIFWGTAVATCSKLMPLDGNWIENAFAAFILHPAAHITHWLGIPFAAGEGLAIDRKVFDKAGGFDVRLVTGEDTDLMKRVSKFGKILYCPKAVSYLSVRRVKKWGYPKYLAFHITNFFRTHFSGKAFGTYEPIR